MQKTKGFISLLLAVVMIICSVGVLPISGFASGRTVTPEGKSFSAAASENAAEGELLVTFSAAVSDKKIEKTVKTENAEIESIDSLGSLKLATVNTKSDAEQTARALSESRLVKSVQPNFRYKVLADDPYMSKDSTARYQYQFDSTNALEAWNELESGTHAKTRVAVVDTGVDINHEDLQANLIKQGGKYAHFEYGELKMVDDDVDAEDGHGTHVSGIIAATYGNDKGGSGIASGHNNDLVELMTVGASADGFNLFTVDIVKAIDYAVNHGARVVNMSFGGYNRDLIMESVIKNAYYNEGVVFVAASGNEDESSYSSPSDLKEVISVNASNSFDDPTYYSNYGTEKDILAPGNAIMSTLTGDDYGNMSGTSMASPVVAGIAALVLDANPDLTPAQVYNILCASAKQPKSVSEAFDKSTGFGIVDAEAAVKAAKKADAKIPVLAVALKSDNITLNEQGEYGAEALVLPAQTLAQPTWSIEDTSIAKVDAKTGVITALKSGETILTVKAGGKSASARITVEPTVDITDITVKGIPESGEIGIGEMISVKAKVVPANATFKDVYLRSSDEDVIAATDDILVAKALGSAKITVESWNGAIKKSFNITVKNVAHSVEFVRNTSWIFLGESYKFQARAVDVLGKGDVANASIEYTSSNKKVFEVDKLTGIVTPKAPGKAFVVATNPYTGIKAAKQLTIAKNDYKGADYGLKQTKATKDSVTLVWNKIPVAASYQIDVKTAGGSWKKLVGLSASKSTYKHQRLKSGTVYYYRIKALYKKSGNTSSFSYSSTLDAKTVPDYRLKQSGRSGSTITLKWNKIPSAAGYQIQFKASKSAVWKTVKTVNAKTLTFKHTKLKPGRTAYYRVRAFYKVSGNVKYFDYSAVLTAKTSRW